MGMNSFQKSMRLGGVALMITGLTACDPDGTLSGLGRVFDPVPASDGAQKAVQRPPADDRGVISYPNYQIIEARRGDDMSILAGRVGISAEELAAANGLTIDHPLRPGEVLFLPKSVPGPGSVSTGSIEDIASTALDDIPNSDATVPAVADGPEPLRHVVEDGETAYTIARLYNVSVTALASWNGLDRNLSVRTGQQLLIPVVEETGLPAAAPIDSPAPAAVAAPVTTAAVTKPGAGSQAPNPPSSSQPLPETIETAQPPASPDLGSTQTTASVSAAQKLLKPVSGSTVRDFGVGGNEGIDFAAPIGTDVKAADGGTVALISESSDDTAFVLLRHANNLYTVYGNLGNLSVKRGDKVSRGQSIGKVNGGSPPNLHFEVRKGTEAVDPKPYL